MKGLDLVLEVSFNINIFLLARKEIYNVQYSVSCEGNFSNHSDYRGNDL